MFDIKFGVRYNVVVYRQMLILKNEYRQTRCEAGTQSQGTFIYIKEECARLQFVLVEYVLQPVFCFSSDIT